MRVVLVLILLACVVQAYVQRHRNYGVKHQPSQGFGLFDEVKKVLQVLSRELKEDLIVFPPKVINDVKGPIVQQILEEVVRFYPGYLGFSAYKTTEIKYGKLTSHYKQSALIGICMPMQTRLCPIDCVVENIKDFANMEIEARVYEGKLKILKIA